MEAKKVTTNYKCQECGQIISSRQYHPKDCCDSFKAGMKEVVEWINQHLTNLVVSTPNQSGIYKTLNENQWQAKLKSWKVLIIP